MMGIYPFSSLMMTFPKGNREINLDIAIAGWKIVLPFFERSQNYNLPSDLSSLCGIIKLELGNAFYEKYENRWGELDVNVEEAIKYFEEGFAALNSNHTLDRELYGESRISCRVKLGISYFYRNQIKGDPGDIEKAIDTYKLVLNSGCQENTLQWVQMNLGNAYCLRQGDPLENLTAAIECYKNSLKVCKQDADRTKWADVHINMGQAYYRRGMLGHPESAEDIESAIESNKNALKVYGHPESAKDIESAIECNKNALKVYNDENKYPLRWAGLQSALGVCYSDRQIGNRAENLESSINYLKQALRVRTQEKYPYDWAITLKTLGIVYHQRKRGYRLANLRQGIDYLDQALEVFTLEKYAVDWAETQGNLGALYKNLAIDLKHNAKYYREAIACLEKTKSVFKPETNPKRWAKTQFELGTCYKNLGVFAKENTQENLAKAIECYRNALRYTSRKSNPFGWAEITNSLGNAYQHNGQYQEAIKCFEDTLNLHTREAFPTDYMKTLFNLGNTHTKFNKLTEAFNTYKEAIDTLENDLIDKLIADDDAKRKFGEEWYQLYPAMVALCLKLGKQNREYYATAWEYAERSKARRLVELFGRTKPNDVSDEIWKEFQDLRNQVTNEQKRIEDKEKSIILSGEILSQHPELEPKKAELTKLEQQLNQKLNDYPRLKATQRVPHTPFSEIGKKLSDDHTVIIQWYLLEADQKFCAFIYTRQSFQPYVWESSLEDLENLEEWHKEYYFSYGQFIWMIKNYKVFDSFEELKQTMISALTSIEESPEEILSTQKERDFMLEYVTNLKKTDQWIDELSDRLKRLAEILHIDELLNKIKNPQDCQQVILIPHRYLHLLPIHALPIKPETWQKFNPNSAPNQDNYLFECFTKGVRYAPSCQTLLMLEKRSRPNFNQLFAMGNPTQDRAFTELCVKTVETFWKQKKPQSETKVLCGEQATKDALIHELKDYLKNAHTFLYSGHGSFEFDSPLDSGLILHEKKRLQLTEIFGLNLEQCRLVTLIGCETGMTDWTSITDEYIGLPSAFLWAGVSGIVSSLWTVEEKASVFLGIKLYQNLLAQPEGEKNVIQALREAQLWLRDVNKNQLLKWIKDSGFNVDIKDWLQTQNKQPFSSPYYWAAFCVIGK